MGVKSLEKYKNCHVLNLVQSLERDDAYFRRKFWAEVPIFLQWIQKKSMRKGATTPSISLGSNQFQICTNIKGWLCDTDAFKTSKKFHHVLAEIKSWTEVRKFLFTTYKCKKKGSCFNYSLLEQLAIKTRSRAYTLICRITLYSL